MDEENGAMLTTYLFRYTSECTFRSQIFKIFFASDGSGALTTLTKILRTFLAYLNALRKFGLKLKFKTELHCHFAFAH